MGDVADPDIACSLTASDQADRIERWRALLDEAEVVRDGSSLHVTLADEHVVDAAELARDEQACCPFLGFRLDFHGSAVALTITAPENAGAVLEAFLPDAGD